MRVRKGGPGRPFFISRPTQTKIPTSGKGGEKWGTQYSHLSFGALNLCEYESRLLPGGRYAAILELSEVEESPFSVETNENPHFWQRRGEMGHPALPFFIGRVESL